MSGAVLLAGRYRLQERLGRGGMGAVWAAEDQRLGRRVAVKEVVPPSDLPDAERQVLRDRTLREARAAARISSPAAVTVYDVVEQDGKPWIVMELLEARTLAQVLEDDGPLSPVAAARVGMRLAEALEAAHAAGVLHRDVKPSNVMVRHDGRAVLTDFGIAVLDGDANLTTTGSIVGSPAYLAPERARGRSASPASDVWSLGATLFAAVEGRSPFQREGQLATLAAVVTEEPDAPVHAGPLRPLLEAMLDKEPTARPSLRAVRQRLERVASGSEPDGTAVLASVPPVAPVQPASRTQALPVVEAGGAPVGRGPGGRAPAAAVPARQVEPPQRSSRGWLVALGLVLAVVALGAAAWALLRPTGDGADEVATTPTTGASEPAAETSEAAEEPPATSSAPTSEEPVATSSPATPSATAPAVPAGFVRYEDDAGWSVAVPEGWTEVRDGTQVDFRGPDGAFLRVDSTDTPAGDPAADWERQEASVSERLDDYERIRIEPVEYRGWDAADWEFTFGEGTRVLNRGFVVSDSEAHALYYSAPEDDFDLAAFEVAASTFDPATS